MSQICGIITSEAARCANTERPLTHSSDYGREGLGMKPTRICSVDGCEQPWRVRRLCDQHYEKARWAGTLPPKRTVDIRLWERVEVTERGCIEFRGTTDKLGYGHIAHQGKKYLAHRMAWMLAHGEIPPRMVICHKCDNPPCINVDHLFLGTVQDNARDMAAKGRSGGQQRTHCPAGHAYSEENTYRYPDGRRKCRTCSTEGDRARRARKAA